MSSAIQKSYETTFVIKAQLAETALKTIHDKLAGLITDFQGEIVLTEDWGKRRLAYPIQKQDRGHYTYLVYTGKPGVVQEIERYLQLQESVLRYLTVSLGPQLNSAQFKKQRAELKLIIKRREEEREARREEKNYERRPYGGAPESRRTPEISYAEDLGSSERDE